MDPKHSLPERRAGLRFPMGLELTYAVKRGKRTLTNGGGRTVNLSKDGILFQSTSEFMPGEVIELSILWPVRLADIIGLTLRVRGCVVWAESNHTALKILQHEFHTRRSPAGAPQNVPASVS